MEGSPEPPLLEQTDEQDIANGAPDPGKLGEGSLGPRKSLGELLGQRLPDYTLSKAYREEQRPIMVQPILNVTLPGGDTYRGEKGLVGSQPVGVHYSEQQPPVIHVHVPEQPPPVVNVTVPVQPAPIVNVTPEVKVELPARQSKKTIQYSPQGWPVEIHEVETNANDGK